MEEECTSNGVCIHVCVTMGVDTTQNLQIVQLRLSLVPTANNMHSRVSLYTCTLTRSHTYSG